jgi:2-oxoisovalerate dehydrogenase E1 component alpha subunit
MEDLRDLYRRMVTVRALNDAAIAMQRQGTLYGFAPCTGQEAAQVGSAVTLDMQRDFVFPTYREFGAMITAGVSPSELLAHHAGLYDGGVADAAASHVAPLYSVVGATALHATGWAMGAKLSGTGGVAIAYFGDGASTQGEIHEAMNFAGIFELPVIFFCQNNGWAISLPTARQVAGGSVAARAPGYGLAGGQVDGNDVIAVRDATTAAVERARNGGGATVIEAMTYRAGPHATSDDPSRYRDLEEEESWRERDPIVRARDRLLDEGGADEEFLAGVDAEAATACERARRELAETARPDLAARMGLAYERPPASFRAQLTAWVAEEDGVHA